MWVHMPAELYIVFRVLVLWTYASLDHTPSYWVGMAGLVPCPLGASQGLILMLGDMQIHALTPGYPGLAHGSWLLSRSHRGQVQTQRGPCLFTCRSAGG